MRGLDHQVSETAAGSVLTAGLMLRIAGRRLDGRVYWPDGDDANGGSALIFVPALSEADGSDPICRLLCSAAATVVLAVPTPRGTGRDDELAALGWGVEHAGELGARPQQLILAGEGVTGARAARLAIRARNAGWPQLRRQILVDPSFTHTCPMPSLLTGVAPATVISSDTRIDEGSAYAERLRACGVEVDVLRYSPTIQPGHEALSATLARSVG